MRLKSRLSAVPYLFWLVVFILLPLLLFFYYGFTVKDGEGVRFSLQNFQTFFHSGNYIQVFLRSLYCAGVSTVICLVVGYPAAMLLASPRYRKNGFLLSLVVIPMWMNLLLRTYSWLTILENNGILNSLLQWMGFAPKVWLYGEGAVIFGMVYNFLPFMILPIYSVMVKIDDSLLEASSDLGASQARTFMKITFPLSLSGVMSGITMVFMPAVTTFAISEILSGRKVALLGNFIEAQFTTVGNWHFGSALSIILIVIILIGMGFASRYEKDEGVGGLL